MFLWAEGGVAVLDDKLREIVQTLLLNDGSDVEIEDFYIECIKQAFLESGPISVDGDVLLTGEQWYERFSENMRGMVHPYNYSDEHVVNTVDACMDAARKASGL